MAFLNLCPRCRIVPMVSVRGQRVCLVCYFAQAVPRDDTDCGCGA